ncbi:hypothetical protein D3C81_1655780 [compost metagenome]
MRISNSPPNSRSQGTFSSQTTRMVAMIRRITAPPVPSRMAFFWVSPRRLRAASPMTMALSPARIRSRKIMFSSGNIKSVRVVFKPGSLLMFV